MDLLARREHSFQELSNKLRKRLRGRPVEGGNVEGVLQNLVLDGLLSDERYAASRARQLVGRGYGPNRIREDLRQQGVESQINSALEGACADATGWLAHAAAAYKKKYKGAPIVGDFKSRQKEKAKRLRFLQYRGFSAELSQVLVSADEEFGAPDE
jgi:regulatory protein